MDELNVKRKRLVISKTTLHWFRPTHAINGLEVHVDTYSEIVYIALRAFLLHLYLKSTLLLCDSDIYIYTAFGLFHACRPSNAA